MIASPQRWENDKLHCSLHSQSETRWSDRIDAVSPIIASSIIESVGTAALQLALTPEAHIELQSLKH